mgnify:FL=1
MKWVMTSAKSSPANPNCNYLEMPEPATRFIALRKDGSGAELFCRMEDGGVLDAGGNICFPAWGTIFAMASWLEDSGFSFWTHLPDEVKLFYENLKAESQN